LEMKGIVIEGYTKISASGMGDEQYKSGWDKEFSLYVLYNSTIFKPNAYFTCKITALARCSGSDLYVGSRLREVYENLT
jgi:hypothetical protein